MAMPGQVDESYVDLPMLRSPPSGDPAAPSPDSHGTFRRVALAFLFLALAATAPGGEASNREYPIKAAFLLNFARLVQWPAGTAGPFVIAVLEPDPFGQVLETTLAGRRVQDRSISIRRVRADDLGEAITRDRIDLLYVPAASPNVEAILRRFGRHATLTVGEGREFLAQGGVVALILIENHVRFAIDAEAARARSLKVSSKLLSLALRDRRDEASR